jgi:D-3-phosphoglycerate dehydrogenase
MSVYVTDYISNFDVERQVLSGRITENKKDAQVLLVWHQKIDKEYLNQFPKLEGIVRYGVGFDVIDIDAVRERNLVFCNTPDYGTDEVSDTAIAMIMNIIRGVTRYDYYCRDYADETWQENTLTDLRRTNSLTLGVIGAGRIGGSIIRKAKAIGLNTLFFDPYIKRGYEKMLATGRVDSLSDLVKVSDIISINTPLTKETISMVDSDFINGMKDGSVFINTSRGEIVSNLDIFIDPLKTGKISGIGLDVLPKEPPADCKLIQAWKRREAWISGRVIINPHTSYFSQESYKEMRIKAAMNAKRILDGVIPHNIIVSKKSNS